MYPNRPTQILTEAGDATNMLWNWQTPVLKFDRNADPSPSPSHVISATFKPKLSNRSSSTSTVQCLHLLVHLHLLCCLSPLLDVKRSVDQFPAELSHRSPLIGCRGFASRPNERTLQSPRPTKGNFAWHIIKSGVGKPGTRTPTQLRVRLAIGRQSPSVSLFSIFLQSKSFPFTRFCCLVSLCGIQREAIGWLCFALLCWDETEYEDDIIDRRHPRTLDADPLFLFTATTVRLPSWVHIHSPSFCRHNTIDSTNSSGLSSPFEPHSILDSTPPYLRTASPGGTAPTPPPPTICPCAVQKHPPTSRAAASSPSPRIAPPAWAPATKTSPASPSSK